MPYLLSKNKTRSTPFEKLKKNSLINPETVAVSIVFCLGMLSTLERRAHSLSLTIVLALLAIIQITCGRTSLSKKHIPLAALPCAYLLSSFGTNGLTYYAVGQCLFMCIPLFSSLCISDKSNSLFIISFGACFLAVASLLGVVVPQIPNTFTHVGFNSDPRFRLQTLLGYANTGALVFGCGIFALLMQKPKTRLFIILKYLAISVLVICILLTQSRFLIIQALVLYIVFIMVKSGLKKSIIFSFVAFISAVGITILLVRPAIIINPSLGLRFIYWYDAAIEFFRSPFFGLGPEGYIFKLYEFQSAVYTVKFVHNALLQAAVDGGILAMLSFCAICFLALRWSWASNKGVFLILLLLLAHSLVDIDLCFFPMLMLLGLCSSFPAESKPMVKTNAIMRVASILVIAVSLYLSLGESRYEAGLKADRYGRLDDAIEAYRSSLKQMPGDFRSSTHLAGVYILDHQQECAAELLKSTDYGKFNNAIRSELLVTAYKNLGHYPEWDNETLALLESAPLKLSSYTERAEYLLAAYYSMLLSESQYENELNSLKMVLNEMNKSIDSNRLAGFLLEKDRLLRLE